MSHAVFRLRAARMAASVKPFVARGGAAIRCERCRLLRAYCVCDLQPHADTRAGVCLLMGDTEAFKPSNTGWLIADVVADTWAFGWSRTVIDPALIALLNDPQWQPCVVFPGEFVDPARVIAAPPQPEPATASAPARRPLFVLLDGTWSEARKMFNKSRYLDPFPVLSLHPDHPSSYRLRRAARDDHFCTAEVAALCLALAGEPRAAEALSSWLGVFTEHYLKGKQNQPVDHEDPVHQRLRALAPVAAP
ncbi:MULTISPECIES: tRNA-uridine aminocarboxypropyltransferase [Hydrogenophaga]|uniref:tRNA-uridine aminocarboxypropyltransferase n=1 Tax=Hydrogenophaga intermedia TaxID=65786 RepID=A0A1L1PNN9_HYDIT|nr:MULTISPECIES: tRNA-uridine aminocarboxypropyltransferase [Hydrogenophaga]AOS78576.1 DTW domain-containing protein [Hydrogenophaga sp. PBC]TMU75099.1 DTW domain-containing protein [Hydrogenophaga intermedia]CDN88547.1 DTW domain containing protein [Hydrogenophaga intermedia]